MNWFLSIILLFLSLSAIAQPKGIKCTYTTTKDVTPEFLNLENETVRNILIDRIRKDKKVYTLTISNNCSLFRKEPTSIDKMPLEIDTQNIYVDWEKDKMIEQLLYHGKQYLISSNILKENWVISQQQDTINGYVCYKAEYTNAKNISYTAWFTPSIPINVAPFRHNGLPGLVVRLTSPVNTLNLVSIEEVKDCHINIPDKGIKISYSELDKRANKNLEDLLKSADSVKRHK